MEAPIRKKVTRVGSGAWSIYLPKKWIDAWEPEQQEGREVDLRRIGEGMLITPVIARSRYEAELPDDGSAIRTWLLSGYVRGYHEVVLKPRGEAFTNDCIAQARDFLRHLDERIEATCGPDRIGFRLRADLPAAVTSGEDLLQMMSAKVDEVLGLAEDAVTSYRHDPERALHALRLLRDTHNEDVSRLFHQATRLVASLEIPMSSVNSYQLLGMAAADLERMSEQALRMAEAIVQEYGITLADLDYPRQHLMERVRQPTLGDGVSRDILRVAGASFEGLRELLRRLLAAVIAGDINELAAIHRASEEEVHGIRNRIFEAAAGSWGKSSEPEESMLALAATKHTSAMVHALYSLGSISRNAMVLLAAGGRGL